MTGYAVFGHQARSRSPALLRRRWAEMSLIACVVSAVLMLIPAGGAWPLGHADTLASAPILEWVKGSLGLVFWLRRRLETSRGDRQ